MRSNVPTLLYYKYFTLSNAGQTTLVYFTLQGEDWMLAFSSGLTTMGSDRENPGAPNLNGPNGGPQA